MRIPIFQIDAFTSQVFRGNPAAVCPLQAWLPSPTLQAIAAENNLSETAFFLERHNHFEIRWFTPVTEVDLCGHATLAAAQVIFDADSRQELRFSSQSGPLRVFKQDGRIALDFPAREGTPRELPEALVEALGQRPRELLASRDWMAVFDSEEQVRALRPDMALLAKLDVFGVIATAPGESADFVSRYFAPKEGVPEDPVTGSAHCTLIPYWARRLGRSRLEAQQVSPRGGELFCEQQGDRVIIAGHTARYLDGFIEVPEP